MVVAQVASEPVPHPNSDKSTGRRGSVMAIGGAEDKFNDRVILSRFVSLAGGDDARIAIVPTASSIEAAGERYKAIFLELGVGAAEVAYIGDRVAANSEDITRLLASSTGIFLTGGNQMRLSTIMGGTKTAAMIRRRFEDGAIIAGTSAGASILSEHMVAFGASGASPRQRMAQMVAGFGLVQNVIIDQHFRQRDRIGRLLMMVAASPGLLGIGIDEDTAILISSQNVLEVIGRHTVTIVDGNGIYSDVYRVKGHGGITISGAVLHMLTHGNCFDLERRELIIPSDQLQR
jgi:cyanophycinase